MGSSEVTRTPGTIRLDQPGRSSLDPFHAEAGQQLCSFTHGCIADLGCLLLTNVFSCDSRFRRSSLLRKREQESQWQVQFSASLGL